tara:strand:- start:815 stop:2377 length:1563 start_codon:yes stop_codon:yes gene_type:complete
MKLYRKVGYTLLIIPVALILFKFLVVGYTFNNILPKTSYEVKYLYSLQSYNDAVNVSAFLPQSNQHQLISQEVNNSPNFNFEIVQDETGRKANWNSNKQNNINHISYTFSFIGEPTKFKISDSISIPEEVSPQLKQYLKTTKNIQVSHPYILGLKNEIIGEDENTLSVLTKIYNTCFELKKRPFKGVTDAVTAAKLGEASCNGKSRLFVALARAKGIPSRLVGGVILKKGTKRTSHQWVEAFVNGYWVPFDPLNGHFQFLPGNYLELYKGDEFLLSHTPNINFDYQFEIKKRLVSNPKLRSELKSNTFNAYVIWDAFERIGISLGLLKIILLMPLGALVVAVCRNVIGIKTFGVFLPALIAIASQETGLGYGILAFLMVVVIVSLVHGPLEKLGLLYTPKMVVMLVCVVIAFIAISWLGIMVNITAFAYVTLFPMVVITITAERFARTIIEEGYPPALIVTLQTLAVASLTYLVMNSTTMEAFFLAFPELFLIIISFNVFLGKWIGMRLTEYKRFKYLIN